MNTFDNRCLTKAEFQDSFRRARLVFGFRRSLPFEVARTFDVIPLLDGICWQGVTAAAAPLEFLSFPRRGLQRKTILGPKGNLP